MFGGGEVDREGKQVMIETGQPDEYWRLGRGAISGDGATGPPAVDQVVPKGAGGAGGLGAKRPETVRGAEPSLLLSGEDVANTPVDDRAISRPPEGDLHAPAVDRRLDDTTYGEVQRCCKSLQASHR